MEIDLNFHLTTIRAFEALSLQRWVCMNVEEMIEQIFLVREATKGFNKEEEEEN
jgi:hypothetical protein